MQLDVLISRDEVMSGGNLEYPIKKCANRMTAVFDAMIDGLRIPLRRDSSRKERLDLRCQVESVLVEGVKQRLNAETIAGSKNCFGGLIPNYKSEFTAQTVQALRAEVLVKMEGNLAIRSSAQTVT